MFAAAGFPCGGFSFVFSLRCSSKQHPRCSGLPKGKPQAPRYCFSSSQKSRSAFARCDLREPCAMLSIISAPHSLFPVQPQVCGKLSALAKSVIFARAIRLLESGFPLCCPPERSGAALLRATAYRRRGFSLEAIKRPPPQCGGGRFIKRG